MMNHFRTVLELPSLRFVTCITGSHMQKPFVFAQNRTKNRLSHGLSMLIHLSFFKSVIVMCSSGATVSFLSASYGGERMHSSISETEEMRLISVLLFVLVCKIILSVDAVCSVAFTMKTDCHTFRVTGLSLSSRSLQPSKGVR